MGHSRHLFLYFDLFNSWHCLCSLKNFADDWIRTSDLWVRKQPLCQLSHNNCPRECKCFFVGWAISRCLSTTPHPIEGQGGSKLLVQCLLAPAKASSPISLLFRLWCGGNESVRRDAVVRGVSTNQETDFWLLLLLVQIFKCFTLKFVLLLLLLLINITVTIKWW